MKYKVYAETDRLILREILQEDAEGFFELDSDKDVHRYLGGNTINTIDESRMMIDAVREQYVTRGIGRWAIVEKKSNHFVGWTGLKLESSRVVNGYCNFYDVGYRLLKRFWGKGYATESACSSLQYGFEKLDLPVVYADADCKNRASRNVLEKIGLTWIERFDDDGCPVDWFKRTKEVCL